MMLSAIRTFTFLDELISFVLGSRKEFKNNSLKLSNLLMEMFQNSI